MEKFKISLKFILICKFLIAEKVLFKAKEVKGNDENHHIVNETLYATGPVLSAVSAAVSKPTPLSKTGKTELYVEQSKDLIRSHLRSPVGTPASDYAHNYTGFRIWVDPIYGALQNAVPRKLQTRILYAYYYSRQTAPRRTQHVGHNAMRGIFVSLTYDVYITVLNGCK